MEWNLTKLAIIVLSVMVLALLLTFYGQFSEILERDKEIQSHRDRMMYEDLKKSIPGMIFVLANQIKFDE